MSKCLYCGNNPIPHTIHKFYESTDILIRPFRNWLSEGLLARISDWLLTGVGYGLLKISIPLGLVQINRDIHQVPYPRARVLWEEAIRRGIEISEIKPFGQSIDLYRARVRNKNLYFLNLPRRANEKTEKISWIDDKYLLKKKLQEHNLPTPRGDSFTTLSAALQALRHAVAHALCG